MRIRLLQDLPIKRRLTLVILLVASIVSISEIVLLTLYHIDTALDSKRVRMRMLSQIVAANCLPALKFHDRKDALEILASLRAEPSIRSAYLFDSDGGLLAEYLGQDEKLSVPRELPKANSDYFSKNDFVLWQIINADKDQLGGLYMISSLEDVNLRRRESLLLGGIVAWAFFGISCLLAIWLQRAFTKPMQELAQSMRQVTEKRDFTVRAQKFSNDEFGVLADALNQMLSEIENRGREIDRQMLLLEKTNKELDQFVYVASHDLKAPLRAVENLTRMISKATYSLLPAEKREYLLLLTQRVQRMERLLDDLLQYSRVGRVHANIEEVNCSAMIREIVELLDPPQDFKVVVPDDLPQMKAEKTPLEQVLRNLIGNAIKHHRLRNGKVEISARDLGEFIEFSVKDDGPGIDAQYHQRIFEMFQTLKPRDDVEGSGMGLALVKKIVEDKNGKVSVHSAEGQGACFSFTWPKIKD